MPKLASNVLAFLQKQQPTSTEHSNKAKKDASRRTSCDRKESPDIHFGLEESSHDVSIQYTIPYVGKAENIF